MNWLSPVVLWLAIMPQTTSQTAQADKVAIKEVVVGKGAKAGNGDIVAVGYSVRIKGSDKLLDSNSDSAPLAFILGGKGLIQGFQDGVMGMSVGGKRSVEVPPKLAYGDSNREGIPNGSTLIFDLELYRIDKPKGKTKIETKILTKGSGIAAKKGSNIKFHFKGSFLNGVEFDNSHKSTERTLKVGAGQILPALDKIFVGVKKGEIRKVTVPYDQALGKNGGENIPPYSTLVFEFEILSVDN